MDPTKAKHQQNDGQQHQARHQLVFVFHKDRRFTQRVAERGQDQHPQQAAHPVKELEARAAQAGQARNGGQ